MCSTNRFGQHPRGNRAHLRYIGCGENTRPAPRFSASSIGVMKQEPIHSLHRPIFWFGRDRIFVPAVCFSTARRKAESRPAGAPPSTRAVPSPGRALTGRAPCYDRERPCRSSAWSCYSLLARRSLLVSGDCSGREAVVTNTCMETLLVELSGNDARPLRRADRLDDAETDGQVPHDRGRTGRSRRTCPGSTYFLWSRQMPPGLPVKPLELHRRGAGVP